VPRTPNAAALTKVQTRLGTEPVTIVEVDWTGTPIAYADKDFLGAEGKIIELSGLDAVAKVGSAGSAGSINITLDDGDGSIKTLLNTNDIHKRPARIYQSYEGLLDGDKFLLFSGEVSSPIVWSEGERTISFSVVNAIEDRELGFAPEDGEFDFVADSAIGVAWPLAFGDVVRVPAVRITEAVRGTSLTHYGQLTLAELETLCAHATTAQQAETVKKVLEGQPLTTTDATYGVAVDNFTSATIALQEYLEALIFDSPTQETDLRSYVDTCKELERWRVFTEEHFSLLAQAEEDLIPLESTPGKEPKSVFKFFTPNYVRNRLPVTTIEFSPEVLAAYRIGKGIPGFDIVIRGTVPETVGLVEQAEIAHAAYLAANWVYTTPEQWEQDALLSLAVSNAQADLGNALFRQSTEEDFVQLGNQNIAQLNVVKLNLEDDLTTFVLTQIAIDGGEEFPQGVQVEIIVNGLHYKGTFAERLFTITQANTPADVSVSISAASEPNQFLLSDPGLQLKGKYLRVNNGVTFCENQNGNKCSISPLLYQQNSNISGPPAEGVGLVFGIPKYDPRFLSGTILETSVYLSKAWMDNIRQSGLPDYATGLSLIRHRDYGIAVGDTVYLAADYKEIYIANLIPSTEIHEVMGLLTVDGEQKLVPIPTQYYTINLNELIAGQNATTLRFNRPLTEFFGEAWTNDVFVSLTSSVGPNTVDIIEHLVDTYTDLTKDAASFAAVHASLAPFPSNFAFLERRGTLGAIEDVAWQARSVAYVKDQTIYLKYLAAAEAALETIDESVVDRRTLELTMTKTEELVTEFNALWDSDYARSQLEQRNQIVLRNNIQIYGTVEEEFDFFIYNIQELVVRSASFWLIRYSNTWKIARFKTPINMLRLETFDTVELDFGQDFIASAPVDGIIEEVSYDSENFELEFEVKTPVRSGLLTPYVAFWPANVAVDVEYPTPEDIWAGS
jgi:hypothetical protein